MLIRSITAGPVERRRARLDRLHGPDDDPRPEGVPRGGSLPDHAERIQELYGMDLPQHAFMKRCSVTRFERTQEFSARSVDAPVLAVYDVHQPLEKRHGGIRMVQAAGILLP